MQKDSPQRPCGERSRRQGQITGHNTESTQQGGTDNAARHPTGKNPESDQQGATDKADEQPIGQNLESAQQGATDKADQQHHEHASRHRDEETAPRFCRRRQCHASGRRGCTGDDKPAKSEGVRRFCDGASSGPGRQSSHSSRTRPPDGVGPTGGSRRRRASSPSSGIPHQTVEDLHAFTQATKGTIRRTRCGTMLACRAAQA